MDLTEAQDWIRAKVGEPVRLEAVHVRPWASVFRVPLSTRTCWFKASAPVQAFEPRLTTSLFRRWPDRVSEVVALDESRAWLLLQDAGTPLSRLGNAPELWLRILPLYAELQRGEAARVDAHLAHDVPDMRVAGLPARYHDLLSRALPLQPSDVDRLRRFEARFGELCRDLAGHGVPDTIQHDDLHMGNVFASHGRLRVLDWGDASVSHPFASLVTTFRFLEETNQLRSGDPWFGRLRDAYLEPWGSDVATFDLAMTVGGFAHCCAWTRQRDALPRHALGTFDEGFRVVLLRALGRARGASVRRRGGRGSRDGGDHPPR